MPRLWAIWYDNKIKSRGRVPYASPRRRIPGVIGLSQHRDSMKGFLLRGDAVTQQSSVNCGCTAPAPRRTRADVGGDQMRVLRRPGPDQNLLPGRLPSAAKARPRTRSPATLDITCLHSASRVPGIARRDVQAVTSSAAADARHLLVPFKISLYTLRLV
jgi:hypothetical protein